MSPPNAGRASLKSRLLAWSTGFLLSPSESTPVDVQRAEFRKAAAGPSLLTGRRPDLAQIADDTLHGVRVRRYRPHDARPGTVVFFHGGGWTVGDLDSYDVLAGTLAALSGHEVVSAAYRLAPENPYPAAFDDAVAVTRAVASEGPVVVAGDSAGGNLAAAVANRVPVLGQLLMYPVLDCANESASYDAYATGHILTREGIRAYRRNYVPDDRRRTEQDASPLHAPSLDHTPPAYLIVAECDVLRDESLAYAERLRAAGRMVTVDLVPGVLHGFLSLLGLSEAHAALARGAAWVDEAFGAG